MKRILALVLALVLCAGICIPAFADEEETPLVSDLSDSEIPIWTAEDMLKISSNPEGTYRLMRDIDMNGVEWDSPSFSGVFHGNGKAILNLHISKAGEEAFSALDRDEKAAECVGAGLFSVMRGARVDYLTLMGVSASYETDVPTFMGAIAGAAFESTIDNCDVVGRMELRSSSRLYGLGGITGFGNVCMEKCRAVTTLICLDMDRSTEDAAFLGGLLSYGFLAARGDHVDLQGYIGARGRTYSGGAVGMLMQYTVAQGGKAEVTSCTINGYLRCMEENNRKPDCDHVVGKVNKVWNYSLESAMGAFETNVTRNEEKLPYPEECENPSYVEDLIDPDCNAYGYSEYKCDTCGSKYRTDYTLKDHSVSEWKEYNGQPDMMVGSCVLCSEEVYEFRANIPELQEEEIPEIPTTLPDVELSGQTGVTDEISHDFTYVLAWGFMAAALCIAAGLVVYVIRSRKKR